MMRKNRGTAGRLAIPELAVVFDFLRSERYPERSGTGITQRANSDEGISEAMRSPHEVPVSPKRQALFCARQALFRMVDALEAALRETTL